MLNAEPERMLPAEAQAPVVAPDIIPGVFLRVLVKGFTPVEHRLLEGAVKLSQRRPPRIDLLDDAHGSEADVVLVDARDPLVLQWAATQPWLADKAMIWAGAKTAKPGHVVIDRNVKWPILPVLLYRALERGPSALAAASSSPPARTVSRRVLIVDDSLAARVHLRSLLEKQGVDVVEAESAEAGIAAAAQELFACVLMDVLMPGMDGFEACRRIKARARAGSFLPVVMLTSKSSPFDRVRGKMAGCDSYLTKPVDAAQLHAVVARHVAAPSPRPASTTPLITHPIPTHPERTNPWLATS